MFLIWSLLIWILCGVGRRSPNAVCCPRRNAYTRAFMLVYLAWIAFDDQVLQTPRREGRPLPGLRHWRLFHWFRNYFPIRLHKTAELDPAQRYIFCYHPHGIIGMGLFINLATEANGWSSSFPGINVCGPMVILGLTLCV